MQDSNKMKLAKMDLEVNLDRLNPIQGGGILGTLAGGGCKMKLNL